MGDYEKDREIRARKRRKRRRRQRITGFLILMLLALALGGLAFVLARGRYPDQMSGVVEKVKTGAGDMLENVQTGFLDLLDRAQTGIGDLAGTVGRKITGETESETEIPVESETESETEPVPQTENHEAEIAEADRLAAMYDYDSAIALLKGMEDYGLNNALQIRVAKYEKEKASCVAINPEDVTHIFYHSLVVDPAKAFDPDKEGYDGWQQWMTTISEFDKITQSMYDRGYVLVSIHDLIKKTTAEDGTVTIEPNQILLPEGKKAYVMSLDDLSYYHTYDNRGVASRIVLDEEGKPTCEYIQDDGTVVQGDYDAVPRLDTFIEEHPDASYRGAKGIIALTGYNGVLGYRTDGTYDEAHNTNSDVYYMDDLQKEWLSRHPDFNWEEECAQAKKVADAMKADGWEFASHTWGHKEVGEASYEELVRDTERWFEYVSPIIGETDTIIFAHGQDIAGGEGYDESNEKYTYLKSKGFDIFCNVDSTAYTTVIRSGYLHQGRRNLDGYRIYQDCVSETPRAADLFDANEVLDPDRPLPVPSLGG